MVPPNCATKQTDSLAAHPYTGVLVWGGHMWTPLSPSTYEIPRKMTHITHKAKGMVMYIQWLWKHLNSYSVVVVHYVAQMFMYSTVTVRSGWCTGSKSQLESLYQSLYQPRISWNGFGLGHTFWPGLYIHSLGLVWYRWRCSKRNIQNSKMGLRDWTRSRGHIWRDTKKS